MKLQGTQGTSIDWKGDGWLDSHETR